MTTQRKVIPAQVTALADDEIEIRMSTATRARDGHILVPQGARLEAYKANPVILWSHLVDIPPIGRAEEIRVSANDIIARVKFPPAGISERADEVRGLAKAGFIRAVSVGFNPIDGRPIDPRDPRGGMRFTDWELLECSFCAIGVDPGALVTQRALRGQNGEAGMKAQSMFLEDALDEHRGFTRHYESMSESMSRLDEHRSRTGTALRSLKSAVATGDKAAIADAHERCRRCMDGMNRELGAIGDRHSDAMDAHSAMARALGSFSSKEIQTSAGIDDTGGSTRAKQSQADLDYRRRQVKLLALTHPPVDPEYEKRQRKIAVMKLSLPP